jgi:exopolysaccharide production protein ExoZ
MWGIPSALLIFGLTSTETADRLPNIIAKFSFFGDSSYSLYLLHAILLSGLFTLVAFAPVELRYLLCVILATVCCIIAAVFYIFLERPLVRILIAAPKRFLMAGP